VLSRLTTDQFQLQECIRHYGLSKFLRIENPKEDGSLTLFNGDRRVEIDADTVITAFYLHKDILPSAL